MEKFQVARFDGLHDFGVWKCQVRAFLNSNECFGVVDGTWPKPEKGEDFKRWKKAETKAYSIIISTLEPQVVRSVMYLQESADIWARLEQLFEAKSKVAVSSLLQEFYAYVMTDDMPMSTHIANVESMAQRLKEIGKPLDDDSIISKMIQLPKKYASFVSAWITIHDSEQTVQNLIPRLLQAETLLNTGQQRSRNTEESVLYGQANRSHKPKSNGKKRFGGACFNCGKTGHRRVDCRLMKRQNRNDSHEANVGALLQEQAMISVYCLVSDDHCNVWVADSAASRHMSFRRDWFDELEIFAETKRIKVVFGDNRFVWAYGVGSVAAMSTGGTAKQYLRLQDVLYVPELRKNLLSLSKVTSVPGLEVIMVNDKVEVRRHGDTIAVGVRGSSNLFRMNISVRNRTVEAHAVIDRTPKIEIWHSRFGHACYKALREMSKRQTVTNMNVDGVLQPEDTLCEPCVMGKLAKLTLMENVKRADKCGQLVHFDIVGPMSVESFSGAKYLAVFVDDYSGYLLVKPMRAKSDIVNVISWVLSEATRAGHKILEVRSDNALEFTSMEMQSVLNRHAVSQSFVAPYRPAQNGRVERQNRTVVEMTRTMLIAAGLPKAMWAEAATAAAYIRNRVGIERLKWRTPIEAWTKCKPDVSNLRVYGCIGYVYIEEQNRGKLDAKSRRMILVGYDKSQSTYRMWLPGTRRIYVSRDVRFAEHWNESSILVDDAFTGDDELVRGDKTVSEEEPEMTGSPMKKSVGRPKGSKNKARTPPTPAVLQEEKKTRTQLGCIPRIDYGESSEETEEAEATVAYCLSSVSTPTNYGEAVESEHRGNWIEAMNTEMNSLKENKTWVLVQPPGDKKVISSMWVYTVKTRPDGEVDRFKARLVVKGCAQKPGIDFTDTYAPVAKFVSIRCLISIAAAKGYRIYQCDVTTAFLYGNLEETIYMRQPDGYDDNSGRVCLLRKALYGLRQSPLQWNKRIDEVLKRYGLHQSNADPCVYSKRSNDLYFLLYVDDGLCIGADEEICQSFLTAIGKEFKIKSREADCFLGIELLYNSDERTIKLHQTAYAESLLKRFGMTDCNPAQTPAANEKLKANVESNDKNAENPKMPYRQLIGALMYLAVCTRPDIAYIVNRLSQYLENPSTEHWLAAKRVLRYIRGTTSVGLNYSTAGECELVAYSDADFASDEDNRKSVSGVCLMYNGTPISWKSRKQSLVTDSTTYAEYVAAYVCSLDVFWCRQLLADIGFGPSGPTVLNIDNQAAECLIKNPTYHERSKHFDVKFHYVRERFVNKEIDVTHVSSEQQLADILTKPMTREKFCKLRGLMNLK